MKTRRTGPFHGMIWLIAAFVPSFAAAADPGAQSGEKYRRFADDGAWCWFSDPRAVSVEGTRGATLAGWVSSEGDIVVGAFESDEHPVETFVLHPALEHDDHAAPSLLVLPDGRVRAFYSKHFDDGLRTRVTERPGDITAWGPETKLSLNNPAELKPGYPNGVCYSNPVLLDDGGLVLFWRGTNWKPCMAISNDGGESFGSSRIVFSAADAAADNRPYVKVAGDDGKRLHIAFTTGHPRNEPRNSLFYCSFDGDRFRRADGTVIGSVSDLPLDPARCDVVHDGPSAGVRAWVWDVAADANGHPVIAYTVLPSESRHVYYRARWTGRDWERTPVVDAGPWFPQTPEGQKEGEPHYSGGIAIDHSDTNRLYLARPRFGVFEIERWDRMGDSWTTTPITGGSKADNVRPFAVRNATADGPHVLWMCVDRRYEHYTRYQCSIRMDRASPPAGSR